MQLPVAVPAIVFQLCLRDLQCCLTASKRNTTHLSAEQNDSNWMSRTAELGVEVTSKCEPSLTTQQTPNWSAAAAAAAFPSSLCLGLRLWLARVGISHPVDLKERSCSAEEAKLCLSPDFSELFKFLKLHKARSCC